MYRLLSALVVVLCVAGCATKPKPIMSYAQEAEAGKLMAGLTLCAANGMLDTYIASRGKGFIQARLNRFVYSIDNVNTTFNSLIQSGGVPSKADCVSMAMTIHGWIDEVNANNEIIERDRQSIQDAINNKPRTTYCNRIGSQTMCSTY